MRKKRKQDHVRLALETQTGPASSGLDDIYLVHDSIPDMDFDEVSTEIEFLGKTLKLPIIINAMTGGFPEAVNINRDMAEIAAEFGLGMAVGSQTIVLEDSSNLDSFTVVRAVNPDGIVIANVSAAVKPQDALKAVAMIEADAIQLHLNIPQELAMPEGDRRFKGILNNIRAIVDTVPVPVIAKEVGFGVSREAFRRLYDVGVNIIDVGGQGGTNFIAIEQARGGLLEDAFKYWGMSTAASLAEVLNEAKPVKIIATGGIRHALDAAKAIALGANLVGLSGYFLHAWYRGGKGQIRKEIEQFSYQLKCVLMMTGASTIEQLRLKPVVIMGDTARWLTARGIDISHWARR